MTRMDRPCSLTLFLLMNGNLPVCRSQELYEYAWEHGVRPVRESKLKPGSKQGYMNRRERSKWSPAGNANRVGK